ncbi:hypothetical protein Tco_1420017 [Tanacetum coccineum]
MGAKASLTQHGYASKTFSSQLRQHQLAFKERGSELGLPKLKNAFQRSEQDGFNLLPHYGLMLESNALQAIKTNKYILTLLTIDLKETSSALVISVRTDRGTEFLNKTLHAFFKEEGMSIKLLLLEHLNRTALSKLETVLWPRSPNEKGVRLLTNPDPAPELKIFSFRQIQHSITTEYGIFFHSYLYDEFFNDGTSRVNKSSSPTDNSAPQDTHPSTNIHPTSEPTTQTNVHAEENNG